MAHNSWDAFEQGKCILRKVIKDDYLEKWTGHLKIDKTTDQIIRELRGQ